METRSIAKRRKMSKLATASFEDLPEEIALQILTHLEFYDNASASQVSKSWKLLCEDQSIWKKINLSYRTVPAKFIEKALRLGCQYLGLCGTEITNLPGPNSFSASNQLKYLSISEAYFCQLTKLTKVSMENLLGATQCLEKLSIVCHSNNFNFQPNIFQNNQTLSVLRIAGHRSLSTETVKLIFTNCLELTEVNLFDCDISVEALSFVCNNLTSKVKKLCLFREIRDNRDSRRFDILEEKHVISITNRCPSLEELDLGGNKGTNFTELSLSAIIEKLQNLVKLRLPRPGGNFSEKVLLEFLGSMPNLKYFQINPWSRENPVVKVLVKKFPNLKINEGTFDIADPYPDSFVSSNNQRLWDIQCMPTNDFNGFRVF